MNELLDEFVNAYSQRNGYLVAQTLSPVAPHGSPYKLKSIWQSTNAHSVKGDIKHFLKTKGHRVKLDNDEVNGWVEVYTAYWHALGEINAGEVGKVSIDVTGLPNVANLQLVNLDKGI